MKKTFKLFLVTILLLNNFAFVVSANTTNDIKFSYSSSSAPIIKGEYESDVYAVDADYFNENGSLEINASEFDTSFNYEVTVYVVGNPNDIVYSGTGNTTNGILSISLSSPLTVGNYIIKLDLDNGLEQKTIESEIGYYYYYEMNISSSYKSQSMINLTASHNTAGFSSTGSLNVNKTKLTTDNELNILLSNLKNFDSSKHYSYKVEYQIFENGHFNSDALIAETDFIPSDSLKINVKDIKDSLALAVSNYNIIVSIIDTDSNTVVHEARAEYFLNDYLFENGQILNSNKVAFKAVLDSKYKSYSDIYLDTLLYKENDTYYINVNGTGFNQTKDYYYKVVFLNDKTVLSETTEVSAKGSTLVSGIQINSSMLKNATSIKMVVSDKPLSAASNQVTYSYNLKRISLDQTLKLNIDNKAIIVKNNTNKNALSNKVKVNNELLTSDYKVEFTNVLSDGTLKTNSKLVIKYQGTVISEYLIIVQGDINGDGKISIADAVAVNKHIAGITNLNTIGMIAADVNSDQNISISDAVMINKHIAGIKEL